MVVKKCSAKKSDSFKFVLKWFLNSTLSVCFLPIFAIGSKLFYLGFDCGKRKVDMCRYILFITRTDLFDFRTDIVGRIHVREYGGDIK